MKCIERLKSVVKKNQLISDNYRYIRDHWKRYWIHRDGIALISEITTVLNQNGIIAFADFGTLLGLVREGHLLQHDLDIDIGAIAYSQDIVGKISQLLTPLSYKLAREFIVGDEIKEQSYKKNHVRIDIQLYFMDGKSMVCYLFHRKTPEEDVCYAVEKRCEIVGKVEKQLFDGRTIHIPVNAEQLLVDKYGNNWRTPDKGWVFWEGPNTQLTNIIGKPRTF